MEKEHKIMVIGFGTVGQGFYELLNAKKEYGFFPNVKIKEIIDIKTGYIRDPTINAIEDIKAGKKYGSIDVIEAIKNSDSDTVCEFTWVNYRDAEPAYSYIRTALEMGKNVITTNKGPIALRYDNLISIAKKNNISLKFKGTVMAGTPSFNLMNLLPGAKVKGIRGILNGTSNYIITRMAQGIDFNSALKEAQSKGYAEADPTNDVDGYDAAAKTIILSKIFGWNHTMNSSKIKGIRDLTPLDALNGTKLIVKAGPEYASVMPEKLPGNDILRYVNGVMNALEINTDTLGPIYVMGPGAGKIETAQAVLTDLEDILKRNIN